MVGIVIVAHSQALAEGVCAVAGQMSAGRQLAIVPAGGLEDGGVGTSLERIRQAVEAVYSEDGVLVLMDLGSAVMTAQMVVEMLPPERQAYVRLSNAPLVEGAVAAAVAAAQGESLEPVQRAAEAAMSVPKVLRELPTAGPAQAPPGGPEESVELIVPNPVGLHARPASLFVQAAARFAAHITIQNVSQCRPPADAKRMMQVASLGSARQGERIRITARGDDAAAAIAALRDLVASGFGEMDAQPPTASPLTPLATPAAQQLPAQLRGIGAAPGCAVGPVFIYRPTSLDVERRSVDEPQAEEARLEQALVSARGALTVLQNEVAATAGEVAGRIFEFHRLMLEDEQLLSAIRNRIRDGRYNAEAAVADVFSEWVKRFEGLDDALMRARAADVRDTGRRLVAALRGRSQLAPIALPGPAIVVAEDLEPSAAAQLDRAKTLGLVTALGGATSHTAILARMWGIPAVVGLGPGVLGLPQGTNVAIDGEAGLVEVDPPAETVHAYRGRGARHLSLEAEALGQSHEPAITRDGRRVQVVANIGSIAMASEAVGHGAEGVGLLRTEFLFLGRATPPDEEEQLAAYHAIAAALAPRPLIVRTLDIGGDKPLPYVQIASEANPFLGVRGLRLCLEQPELFETQLRAILRAAVEGNVRIMFPMVTTRDELLRAKDALAKAGRDLEAACLPHAGRLDVGIMVETPAAALLAGVLAAEVDFLSIGSNDLTQYTLACDRTNERLQHLYDPLEPAVLRLISTAIAAAHAAGKWAGVCGEMAGQSEAIPLLLGLGLDEFSMAAHAIPPAKRLLRALDAAAARSLAERALTLRSAAEVRAQVSAFLGEAGLPAERPCRAS